MFHWRLEQTQADPEQLRELFQGVPSRAWLYLSGSYREWLELAKAPIHSALQDGITVLYDRPDTAPALPADQEAVLRKEDAHHALASDPALTTVRSTLLQHARSQAVVHLFGERGTPKKELVDWLHSVLDDRPLDELSSDRGVVEPGRWIVAHNVDGLKNEGLQQLQQLLQHRRRNENTPAVRRPRNITRPAHPAFRQILGESPELLAVLNEVIQIAPTTLPALIYGEPGVGKESLARAVHDLSRRPGRFIPVDMGAMPETLAASILFGHVRGAFTGATAHPPGVFEQANNGTLFLDEMGNLSPAVQVKLLRALQDGIIRPLGSQRTHYVDVRVVAATNANLERRVSEGSFRADLLSRLKGATLRLPPLRERTGDIALLAQSFIEQLPGTKGFTPEAQRWLGSYSWPGNIRELTHVVRYAHATSPSREIGPEHLGPASPRLRRATPLFTTSSLVPAKWSHIDRTMRARLTALTVRLPPLRDVSEQSRLHYIHQLAGGRPITRNAALALARHAWWGNQADMTQTMADLRHLPPGPVDYATLQRVLPHVLVQQNIAPLHFLLSPSRGRHNQVTGLTRTFEEPSVLIGRIAHFAQLQTGALGDPTLKDRLHRVGQLTDRDPACLDLSLVPTLSRAHLLVTRADTGIQLHLLAQGPLLAEVSDLASPRRTATLEPDHAPFTVEEAAQITLRLSTDANEPPVLQFYVFVGDVAWHSHAEEALRRSQRQSGPAKATIAQSATMQSRDPITLGVPTASHRTPPTQRAPRPQAIPQRPTTPLPSRTTGRRVWALDPEESAALVGWVASFNGGTFKTHMLDGLDQWKSEPNLHRLANFFATAPRMAQYVGRLLASPQNESTRLHLAQQLQSYQDGRTRLLPKAIRMILPED